MKGKWDSGKDKQCLCSKGTPGTGVITTLILGATVDLWIPWAGAGLLGAPLRGGHDTLDTATAYLHARTT